MAGAFMMNPNSGHRAGPLSTFQEAMATFQRFSEQAVTSMPYGSNPPEDDDVGVDVPASECAHAVTRALTSLPESFGRVVLTATECVNLANLLDNIQCEVRRVSRCPAHLR